MSPEEIANHVAVMIEALRSEAEKYARGSQFVYRMLTSEHVIAAVVSAYLAGIPRGAEREYFCHRCGDHDGSPADFCSECGCKIAGAT